MQAMRWDDLQYFLGLARTGQHGRAAALLGVDATTVARRVRRLEEATGTRLFEQGRDGQTLTEAGRAMRDTAEAMDRLATVAAGREAPGTDGGATGLLRVSVSEGFGSGFVAPRLPGFARLHPRLALDLVASSGFLSPTRRETDVAILLGRPRRGPLVVRKLADYALGLYAARTLPDPPRDTAGLRRHPLIGYIPDLLYAPELNYLGEVAPGIDATIRSSSIMAQARLTAAGAGIAVLPCFLGGGDPALVRILPDRAIRRSFWLVTHHDVRDAARVRAFIDWIVGEVAAARDLLMG